MSEKVSEMPRPFPKPVDGRELSSAKSVAQTGAAAHRGALWSRERSKSKNQSERQGGDEKTGTGGSAERFRFRSEQLLARLEVQFEVKHVVNSIPSVNQANVIADYNVPISRRRGAKANE